MRVKLLTPCSSSIGEENIDAVGVLLDLREKTLYTLELG